MLSFFQVSLRNVSERKRVWTTSIIVRSVLAVE
jgi:hypothetical protein